MADFAAARSMRLALGAFALEAGAVLAALAGYLASGAESDAWTGIALLLAAFLPLLATLAALALANKSRRASTKPRTTVVAWVALVSAAVFLVLFVVQAGLILYTIATFD